PPDGLGAQGRPRRAPGRCPAVSAAGLGPGPCGPGRRWTTQWPAPVTGGSAAVPSGHGPRVLGAAAGGRMRQLARRIQRLESTGTFVDVHRSFNRLVAEAAL